MTYQIVIDNISDCDLNHVQPVPRHLQHPEAGLRTVFRVWSGGQWIQATLLESAHDTTGNHQQPDYGDQNYQHKTVVQTLCNQPILTKILSDYLCKIP